MAVLALTLPAAAATQTKSPSWSVEAAHGPAFRFERTFEEGTWISLDVSPDGRTLVFDLLGDLYILPVGGGTATRITQGAAYDMQPRFSPDGGRIAFISDRAGGNDLWIADADGRNARRLTHELHASLMSPAWAPDGQNLYATRHDDLKAEDAHALIRISAIDGATKLLVDTRKSPLGPVASPDGKYVYFATAAEKGIDRVDFETGELQPVVRGYGGAVRPALSPDGKWLTFGRRFGSKEQLVLRDLATGAERSLPAELNWDQQDNPDSDVDSLPGYAFAPNSRSIYYSGGGRIRRYDLSGNASAEIPFRARFEQRINRRWGVDRRVARGPVALKLLRWMQQSPDGRSLFFAAAGKIYRYDLRRKVATRIVDDEGLEYAPSLSPDGRWLAYVGWTDAGLGHVFKTPADRFAPTRLTDRPGHYEHIAWSPDGGKLVFLKSSGGELRGEANLTEALAKSVNWIDLADPRQVHEVARVGSRGDRRQEMRPSFDGTGNRIYFSETPIKRQPTTLYSIKLDGSDKRRLAQFRFADDIMPSPDGKWVAFTEQFEVYLAPLPADGSKIEIDRQGHGSGARQLSRQGGYFVNWSADGRSLSWSWGSDFFRQNIAEASIAPAKVHVAVSEPRPVGAGELLLRGARIATMGPAGVIDEGDLLVRGDRIAEVGPAGSLRPGPDTRVIDARGKFILPGLIDTHNHYRQARNAELFPQQDWGYVVQLAYGVTTIRDPSARSQSIFTQSEMIETGRSLGPRLYSTGEPIYFEETAFARPLESLDDARLQVRRLKALGAAAVKLYIQPRREQRQWLLQAAREEGLPAIPEGAQKIAFDLTLLMDGYSTLEHAIKTAPLYKDVTSLFAATGTYLVPTLIVGPGGAAEDYFYASGQVGRDERLMRFTPSAEILPRDSLRQVRAPEDYFFKRLARSSADILHAGGRLALGAHGNLEGLGVHWEMWAMADGGLSPMETLRAATIDAAGALGLQSDLGSLEPGKIADLIILDADPLQDIRNSTQVREVMKDGVLWDASTMDQLWPRQLPFPGFYWRRPS